MELFLLIIRLALSVLFATAGFAKLADIKGSEKAFEDFGVPPSVALPSSIALSVVELVIAILFLFPSVSWFASIGAAALLALFIVQMIYQRAKGNAPDCHCFGQLHSEPVSLRSIVRNGVFLALTLLPLSRGISGQGLSLDRLTPEDLSTIMSVAMMVMLAGALLYLRRIVSNQDSLRRRLDILEIISREGKDVDHEHASDPQAGLPVGSPLPSYQLNSLAGSRIDSRGIIAAAKGALFVFVSPTCRPCEALLPKLASWTGSLADRVNVAFITSGSERENRAKFADLDAETIFLDEDRRFAKSVGAKWTPTALYVDPDKRISSLIAAGDTAIEELIQSILSADGRPIGNIATNGGGDGRVFKIGVAAPDFELIDIEGRPVSRHDLLGRQTLVTFWSPTCPHCANFLDEFRKWERSRTDADPSVVVFSDGDIETHKSLGLDSPVVLDKNYAIAGQLGMSGTPSAVLIDENGVIRSETAIGATNIWALLGRQNGGN